MDAGGHTEQNEKETHQKGGNSRHNNCSGAEEGGEASKNAKSGKNGSGDCLNNQRHFSGIVLLLEHKSESYHAVEYGKN